MRLRLYSTQVEVEVEDWVELGKIEDISSEKLTIEIEILIEIKIKNKNKVEKNRLKK